MVCLSPWPSTPLMPLDTIATNMSDDEYEPSEQGFVMVDVPPVSSLDPICRFLWSHMVCSSL
jgi:hypothetical protein